jgi:hypothetical protein
LRGLVAGGFHGHPRSPSPSDADDLPSSRGMPDATAHNLIDS